MLGLKSIYISKGTKDVTTPSDDLHDDNIIYQMKVMFRYTAKQSVKIINQYLITPYDAGCMHTKTKKTDVLLHNL